MTDLTEIKRMSMSEYRLRMKAYRLRKLDTEYDIAMQAWMNREVQATRKRGKGQAAYYKRFRQFFDYEGRENEILGIEKEHSELAKRYIEIARAKDERND